MEKFALNFSNFPASVINSPTPHERYSKYFGGWVGLEGGCFFMKGALFRNLMTSYFKITLMLDGWYLCKIGNNERTQSGFVFSRDSLY